MNSKEENRRVGCPTGGAIFGKHWEQDEQVRMQVWEMAEGWGGISH